MICDIYRSSKRDEMYLYVARSNVQGERQADADSDHATDPFAKVPGAIVI